MAGADAGFDDDDFGEFGEFEAAEPTDPCEAKPLSPDTQAATPWVIAAVASSIHQSENAVTPCGDTKSDVSQHVSGAVCSEAFSLDDLPTTGTNWAALGEDVDAVDAEDENKLSAGCTAKESWAEKALHEQERSNCKAVVSKVTNNQSADSADTCNKGASSSQVTSKSDILNDLDFDLDDDLDLSANHVDHLSKCHSSDSSLGAVNDKAEGSPLTPTTVKSAESTSTESGIDESNSLRSLTDLHLLRQQQQQIKEELQQELDRLSKHNEQLEDQRQKLQQQLDEQEQKYQLLQDEQFVKQLDALKEEHRKSLRETIKSLKEQHKEELCSLLQEEAKKAKKAIQEAIQEEQERQKKYIEEALEKERKRSLTCLQEERKKWQMEMNEIKKEMLHLVENTLKEEKEKSEVAIKKALQAEREEHSEAIKRIVSESREQVEKYIQEKEQADKNVLQKSLAATEMYLESARQQIASLLQKDTNAEAHS